MTEPVAPVAEVQSEPSAAPDCAHLHLHSAYSLTDGLLRLDQLATECPKRGISAVAMTDKGNLFGFIGFYKKMRQAGVKPLCGVEVPLRTAAGSYANLVLLARNEQGYRNLIRLVSRAYKDESFDGYCRLEREWLEGNTQGLTALSCGYRGEIGSLLLNGDRRRAEEQTQRLAEIFDGEFCLEVTRQGRASENEYLAEAVELSARTGQPLVASNDVRFLNREDFEAHEARVCVAQKELLGDPKRPRRYTDRQYLLSAEQMAQLFSDLPEALDNARTLAQRCNLTFEFDKLLLPSSQVDDSEGSEEEWIRRQAADGLTERMAGAAVPDEYAKRLQTEIEIIERMGFVGYYLVVAEFVNWAKQNDVRVGPGRGSGAGSLVAWALGITDIDPLRYGLLFERFLNPERVSPPDFDIDFEPQGRGRVIDHVVQRYGRDAVAQIATLDVAQAKGAVRDATRVLGKPHGLASRICDLVPFDMKLSKATEDVPELQEMLNRGGEEREILELARQLEGVPRNASRHAGGVVIAPGAVEDYAPLFRARGEEWLATQYDKKDLESIGLVKFDFLGLTTLRIIDDALEQANLYRATKGEVPIDRSDMVLEDPKPYELIASGWTAGIFQLESPRMLLRIKSFMPQSFNDLIALLALIRPGPLEAKMFDQAVRCKTKGAKIKPPHKLLHDVVADTWGVMVYQEQVMEAARRLANYSYGQADELRRAMGTKDREEMARHRSVFVQKAGEGGIVARDAESVFDKMEHFAGYGFNKSHSAAYALISFQTAWLKQYYPVQFMAASLTQESQNATDSKRRWMLLKELQKMEFEVLPPDVNASSWGFAAEEVGDKVCLRFGMGALNGIGEAPCEAISQARAQDGVFEDLYDLSLRCGLHRWDLRILQALNDAGALESLGLTRLQADAQLENARQYALQKSQESALGQEGLFGGETTEESAPSEDLPRTGQSDRVGPDLCPPAEKSRREKQVLGVYLMHHPASTHRSEFAQIGCQPIASLQGRAAAGNWVLAGCVHDLQRLEQGGRPLCVLTLEDESGSCEILLREELGEAELELLRPDNLVLVTASRDADDRSGRLASSVRSGDVSTLAQMRWRHATRLVVRIDEQIQASPPAATDWQNDGCKVVFRCQLPDVTGDISMGARYCIRPEESVLETFYNAFGSGNVWFEYN